MTDTEINMALAKWAGWTIKPCMIQDGWLLIAPDGTSSSFWCADYESPPTLASRASSLPNYCGSLDSVATLEAKFKASVNDAGRRWSDALMRVIQDTDPSCVGVVEARYKTATATARQRAEALARTVGVWRDE